MKTILTLFLFFLSLKAQAIIVIDFKAMLKYNSTKSHYLVTVPENNESWKGYTAVFNAESKALLFKTDTYFHDGMVFLSENGNVLFHINNLFIDGKEQCSINTITAKGEIQTYDVFTKAFLPRLISHITSIADVYTENKNVIIECEDSIYSFSTETFQTTVRKRETQFDEGKFHEKFNAGFSLPDSVFNLNKLTVKGVPLMDKLLQETELKNAEFTLELEIILNTSGDYEIQRVYVKTDSRDKNIALRSKIIALIKSYELDTKGIPEGLEYWYFVDRAIISSKK